MSDTPYTWHGTDPHGNMVSGIVQAESADAVRQQLRAQRIRARSIQRQRRWAVRGRQRQLTATEVTWFTRQLATLLHGGIPLLQSLTLLMQSHPGSALHEVSRQLKQHMEAGMSLHNALRQRPEFDALFCHLVQAGEMIGALDTLLERLASHREKSAALRQSLQSALLYPLTVLGIAIVVTGLLLSFVVPAFASVYASFQAELPLLTRQVLALSQLWQHVGGWSLLGLLVLLTGLRWALARHPPWRRWWHRAVLRLPRVGPLVQQASLARWTRTLATLLRAGIALNEALAAVAGVSGNLHYAEATHTLERQLMQGASLTQGLQAHPHLFPPLLMHLCSIGEESGTLAAMLDQVADHFESNVARAATQLTSLIEPVLMVLLGLLVGGLVLALYLPIFQLGQVV